MYKTIPLGNTDLYRAMYYMNQAHQDIYNEFPALLVLGRKNTSRITNKTGLSFAKTYDDSEKTPIVANKRVVTFKEKYSTTDYNQAYEQVLAKKFQEHFPGQTLTQIIEANIESVNKPNNAGFRPIDLCNSLETKRKLVMCGADPQLAKPKPIMESIDDNNGQSPKDVERSDKTRLLGAKIQHDRNQKQAYNNTLDTYKEAKKADYPQQVFYNKIKEYILTQMNLSLSAQNETSLREATNKTFNALEGTKQEPKTIIDKLINLITSLVGRDKFSKALKEQQRELQKSTMTTLNQAPNKNTIPVQGSGQSR